MNIESTWGVYTSTNTQLPCLQYRLRMHIKCQILNASVTKAVMLQHVQSSELQFSVSIAEY